MLIYEDLEHLTPHMHTDRDTLGESLNAPELVEASARLAAAGILALAGLAGDDAPRFVRGDARPDGALDISDAVAILSALFLGEPAAPECPKSLDADDSGAIDLTDAVAILGHLFLGGAPPPAPYPGCGTDPTVDSLSCSDTGPCR